MILKKLFLLWVVLNISIGQSSGRTIIAQSSGSTIFLRVIIKTKAFKSIGKRSFFLQEQKLKMDTLAPFLSENSRIAIKKH